MSYVRPTDSVLEGWYILREEIGKLNLYQMPCKCGGPVLLTREQVTKLRDIFTEYLEDSKNIEEVYLGSGRGAR